MAAMKARLITFSPTGGTQRVAEVLAEAFEVRSQVDLCDRGFDFFGVQLEPDEVAIIAVPSFGGRVPALAGQRLCDTQGNGAKAVLVAVYGGRAFEDTLAELNAMAAQVGYRPVAAVAALAQHSIMPQYAAGRPSQQDEQALRDMGRAIVDKLAAGNAAAPEVPGQVPDSAPGSLPLVPKTSSACTQCKTCARTCPAGAIDLQDCRKTDKHACISCMRCINVCPEDARSVSKLMVSAAAATIKKQCETPKAPELFI